jgi:hypothetical protein
MENAVRTAHYSDGTTLTPGATYYYNVMGNNAGVRWNSDIPGRWTTTATTQAAWMGGKEANTHLGATNTTFRGCSYGSGLIYGFGSPEGWMTLIIAADATDPDAE